MRLQRSVALLFVAACASFQVAHATKTHATKTHATTTHAPTVLDEKTKSFDDLHLTLTLPELESMKEAPKPRGQTRAQWTGKIGEIECSIRMVLLDREKFRFSEPFDITSLVLDNWDNPGRLGKNRFLKVAESYVMDGQYGYASYATVVQAGFFENKGSEPKKLGSLFLLGSLLESHGCVMEIETQPAADAECTDAILDFFENGFRYEGEPRNIKWNQDVVEKRWNESAPESAQGKDFRKPLRTAHYIILTNSSGGASFGKKMEANYKKIKKVFPFEEVKGRMLMPVFLFRTPDQYYEFCVNIAGWSKEKAKKSKGHAWKDYYATWYESPNDPVHIHEATHQIFSNRLDLNGGGSWYQEGVAEYMETKKNDRNHVATQVKTGKATGLREFMSLRSLLHSSGHDKKTGNRAGDHYKLAALLIEFLRESRFGKKKFDEFIHRVGKVRRNDLEAIERELIKIYGEGIDEIEARFIAYCKKR